MNSGTLQFKTKNRRRLFLGACPLIFTSPTLFAALPTVAYSIGVAANLGNQFRATGGAIIKGVRSAVGQFVLGSGQPISVEVINHDANIHKAEDLLNQWVKKPRLIGLLGGGSGGVAAQLVQWTDQHQLPYGVAWASNADLLKNHPTVFRLASTDSQAALCAMNLAQEAKQPKWGLLLANNALGRASYDALLPWMTQAPHANHFVGVQWHSILAQEIGAQYNSLRIKGAQWIFLVGEPRSALELSLSLQKQTPYGGPLVFCSSNAWDPHLFSYSQGKLAQQQIFFSLPKRANPIYQGLPTELTDPASWNAFVLTKTLLTAFQAVSIESQDAIAHLPAKNLWQQIVKAIPAPHEMSELLSTQYYRYEKLGSLIEASSPAVFTSTN
jgi:hypothetical protein